MKILAIDSSGLVASVALLDDDKLVGEYTIHNKKTHSQTLLPMIDAMLTMAEVPVEEVDMLAVAAGPGSFTGLRIGASTAKGLAQALAIPIVPVPTL
ncbi:MAG: tRNA (adenosine(37)-N6)-threonylcarbamoyltransferase complex dimerization subunit type 1 TsaB, partial [Eubacterium sp.]|nr:tRNA (adenosine(37)-N6)-threonylcarbamoyltransferase complex dimerization subunit type 1 TsaB [Eubacterium sp.]